MSHYLTLKKIGKTVAYYPNLTKKLGNVNASILLSQFIYWHDKTENPLGVYKSQIEIAEETGLSRYEQENGRKVLRQLGLITETYKRTEHKLYFLFHPDIFDSWFDEAMLESDIPECGKTTLPNDEKPHSPMGKSNIRSIHKSTSKSTSKELNVSFDDFWNLYDKKVGAKEKVQAKWEKLKDDERLAVMEHLPKYKLSQPNKKYRKDPSTYLNNKSWNDEVIFENESLQPVAVSEQATVSAPVVNTQYKSVSPFAKLLGGA